MVTATWTAISAFYCTPISYAWHLWDGQSVGRCINIQAATLAQATLNMVLEIALVALPMPTVYQLQMPVKKKLQVLVLFSLGLIVVVICILRLVTLIREYDVPNITWHAWEQGIWDAAEVYVSIICVCLPSAKVVSDRLAKRCRPDRKAGRERGSSGGPSVSVNTITKRTSVTLSWSRRGPGTAARVAPLPEWATGWEGGEDVERTFSAEVTAGTHTTRGGRTLLGP